MKISEEELEVIVKDMLENAPCAHVPNVIGSLQTMCDECLLLEAITEMRSFFAACLTSKWNAVWWREAIGDEHGEFAEHAEAWLNIILDRAEERTQRSLI